MFKKFGWNRDLPDFRDYSNETPVIKAILDKSIKLKQNRNSSSVDLRKYCSPIEDQGDLGSCTANAGVSLLEYYEKRAFNKYLDGSRLFLYKTTRNLDKCKGDVGAYIRDTMKAMVLFGIPPEEYWPYDETKFDDDPSAFIYSLAQNYKSIQYYRLDPPGYSPSRILINIKNMLSAGFPSMFGFTVYSNISYSPNVPFPTSGDSILGGHAVMCCGFNDSIKIEDQTGALLIKNSWGTSWGDNGYGWLPYAYILNGLAVDFWSLIEAGFVDTDLFS
jgi:C1A family cysteine protease